jgi:hypothetical protein
MDLRLVTAEIDVDDWLRVFKCNDFSVSGTIAIEGVVTEAR